MSAANAMAQHSMIDTTFPVDLPDMPELHLPNSDFDAYITSATRNLAMELPLRVKAGETGSNEATEGAASSKVEREPQPEGNETSPVIAEGSKFVDALLADKSAVPTLDERDGKMLTENADVAHRTSGQALVDLFSELEDVISGTRLCEVLEKAWQDDSEAALKIIWNARSIHLGKSSRPTFYRAVGWLAENHPATLLTNLAWLVRPVIQKKAPKPAEKKADVTQEAVAEDAGLIEGKDADSDFEIVEDKSELEGQPEVKKLKRDEDSALTEFDVKFGVAHGYWKDLLNILALAANSELKADGNVRKVLNPEKPSTKKLYKRDWTEGRKRSQIDERHERAVQMLESEPFYKALHVTVARLFADQLKVDLARVESGDKAELKRISLAAKWAPSHKGMHDQHTCIVTSIAELLCPFDVVCPEIDAADRTLYLKHARQTYQLEILSRLRKALQVVERPITRNAFDEIQYERVPSLAMKQYTTLFAKKDYDRFDAYIDKVAEGKAQISGATLLPSTLVKEVANHYGFTQTTAKGTSALVEKKLHDLKLKTIDGQWNSLVQRIKDNGTLDSSIAVCDVSGSMCSPRFPDGTCPMDSAIGLSLLLAEVTKPPFGGAFITFSHDPQVLKAGGPDDKRSFREKVSYIRNSNWGMNTDFVAVFERLILPLAVENKLSQEDMVKQVFVFSDMQFDGAGGNDYWTSFERIRKQFKDAGYEMPKLIFWNLAGGRAGYESGTGGDDVAPKPVTAAEENTALVSGYSQGQLKMFLDNGHFEDPEDEVAEQEGEDGDEVVVEKKKPKQDPLATVKKAISHEAYRMLKVVD